MGNSKLLGKWVRVSNERIYALRGEIDAEKLGDLYQEMLLQTITNFPDSLHVTVYKKLLEPLTSETNNPITAIHNPGKILEKLKIIIQARENSQENELVEVVLKNIFSFIVYQSSTLHNEISYLEDAKYYALDIKYFIKNEEKNHTIYGESNLEKWLLTTYEPTCIR